MKPYKFQPYLKTTVFVPLCATNDKRRMEGLNGLLEQ